MRRRGGFTIVELMVVISIIMLLISFLLPSLAEARDHARYAKWAGYSHNLRVDPTLLVYYNFEQQGASGPDMGYLWNRSALDAMDMARRDIEPEYFHSRFWVGDQPDGGSGGANRFSPETNPGRRWKRGRWRSKDALEFDDQGFNTQTPHDDSMNFERRPGHSWSLLVWFNSANIEPWDGIVTKALRGAGSYSYSLELQPSSAGKGTLKFECSASATGGVFTGLGTREFEQGQWTHAALVYDGLAGEYRFYLNGYLDVVIAKANVSFINKEALVLGMDNPGGVEYFTGRIDEVALFAGPLSDTKIKEHYDIGRPRRSK